MKYTIEEATKKAHQMYVYESSEQADQQKIPLKYPFDGIWFSMYDVCKLYALGIIDDVEPEEFEEAKQYTEKVSKDIDDLEANLRDLPTYISVTRQYLPKRLNELKTISSHRSIISSISSWR